MLSSMSLNLKILTEIWYYWFKIVVTRVKVMEKDEYLKDIIKKLKFKREQSIAEFPLTDLNNGTLEDVHLWYDNLLKLIKSNPPVGFVNTIIIKENDTEIKNIYYKYSDNSNEILAFTIMLDS